MNSDRRLLAGVVPAAILVGGMTTFFVVGSGSHSPVTAQDTATLTTEQRTTATALEGAFMRISDTVGPATVRIKSVSAPQSARRLGGSDSGDGEGDAFPFGQFFSGPGAGEMPPPGCRAVRRLGRAQSFVPMAGLSPTIMWSKTLRMVKSPST